MMAWAERSGPVARGAGVAALAVLAGVGVAVAGSLGRASVLDSAQDVPPGSAAPGAVAAAAGTPFLRVTLRQGQVYLSGAVGSSSAQAGLVRAAQTVVGAGAVRDRTQVVTGAGQRGTDGSGPTGVEATSVSRLGRVLTALRPQDAVVLEVTPGHLVATGTAVDAAEVSRFRKAAAASWPAGAVTDRVFAALDLDPASAEGIALRLSALPQVQFRGDTANLTREGYLTVGQAAQILAANPKVDVRVESDTAGDGTPAALLALSRRRAANVVRALVARGVAASRLTSQGFGDTRPLVPDTSEENRATDTRVTFVVVG